MVELPLQRDPAFILEQWIEYGIAVFVIFLRYSIRIRTVGIRGFRGDDFLAIVILTMLTMDSALSSVVYATGTNLEVPTYIIPQLSESQQQSLTRASKIEFVGWYTYTALIWALKGSMLFLYHRLSFGLPQERLVKWLGLACAVSYIAIVLTITFGCWPIADNWKIYPPPTRCCGIKIQNIIVTCVMNVLTDAGLLCIPIPWLWALKVPLRQKISLGILFSSGIFVIAAAITRTCMILGPSPSSSQVNRWGIRETAVAILTVNLPILRSLARPDFWRRASSRDLNSQYLKRNKSTSHEPYLQGQQEQELATDTRENDRCENYAMSGTRIPNRARGGELGTV